MISITYKFSDDRKIDPIRYLGSKKCENEYIRMAGISEKHYKIQGVSLHSGVSG